MKKIIFGIIILSLIPLSLRAQHAVYYDFTYTIDGVCKAAESCRVYVYDGLVLSDSELITGISDCQISDSMNIDFSGYTNLPRILCILYDSAGNYIKERPIVGLDFVLRPSVPLASFDNFNIAETTYAKFTSGSNEDEFKADVSALALQAEVANLDGWNPTSDSVLTKGPDNYKADVSALALQSEVENLDGWHPITDNDTLIPDMSSLANRAPIGDTAQGGDEILAEVQNLDGWDPPDSFIIDMSSLNAALDNDSTLIDFLRAAISAGGLTAAQVWAYGTRTLTALGFTIDSADFGDSAFVPVHFGTNFWDSARGEAAGLTPAQLWAYATRTINGGYIDSNKSEQGGSAGGDGAWTRYVIILDSADGNSPVTDAPVFANDTNQSMANPYFDVTNNTGKATFQLDGGYWVIIMNKAGYHAVIDTVSFSATGTDTLYTYASTANKTPVYGILRNAAGQPYEYAEIRVELIAYPVDSILEYNDTIITQTIVYDTADVNGYWTLALYANADLSDSSFYRFWFRDQYGSPIQRESGKYANVPDTTSIDFMSLTRW